MTQPENSDSNDGGEKSSSVLAGRDLEEDELYVKEYHGSSGAVVGDLGDDFDNGLTFYPNLVGFTLNINNIFALHSSADSMNDFIASLMFMAVLMPAIILHELGHIVGALCVGFTNKYFGRVISDGFSGEGL